MPESNWRPSLYEGDALPTELNRQNCKGPAFAIRFINIVKRQLPVCFLIRRLAVDRK